MVTSSVGRLYRRCVELLSLALRPARRHRLSGRTRTIVYEYEIPFHIQEEIMKRLPVKSLALFRSVSKEWKSLIDSTDFIAAHALRRHTQSHHLLVSYDGTGNGIKYVSYIDDHNFLQKKSVVTPPPSVKQLGFPAVLGSSHSLLCVYGYDPNSFETGVIVLWNPSIRKSTVLVVPGKAYLGKPPYSEPIVERPCIGFGVCPLTIDPKIVLITESWDKRNIETSYRCKVMVYTLSSGKWRSLSTNLPAKLTENFWWVVITDKFIYWPAMLLAHKMVMSFDVTNESFEAIDLPDSLARHDSNTLHISKLRESLVIFESDRSNFRNNYTVWILEGGAKKLFTKLFTIKTSYHRLVGFRKSGTPMMQVRDHNEPSAEKLVVYEPDLEHNNVIERTESYYSFHVNPYMESLLLLGRSDSISY